MKKIILTLLSLFLLLSFFGCSNPSGGDDDSNTSSAATWQIQTGFVNNSWEFSETQAQGFSAAGSKITLANPNFTKITNVKCFEKQGSSWSQLENEALDYTIGPTDTLGFTDTNIRIINNTVIITTNVSSLTETDSSQMKFIFTFDDNSNLIYFW